MNEHVADKNKNAPKKTELGFEVYAPDTTLVTENGKEYLKILNPHPYISYIKIGEKDYYKVLLRKDIPKEAKLTQKDEVNLIKKLVNFNTEFDSLTFDEYLRSKVYHKGLRVRNFDFNKYRNTYNIVYKPIDIDVEQIISKQEAVTIAKQKAIDIGIKIADTSVMNLRTERLRTFKKDHPVYVKYDTTITFEIRKYNNKFYPAYNFKLYSRNFIKNPIFTINAYNGDILLIEDDSKYKCYSCYGSGTAIETDCSLTHPHNSEPSSKACEFLPENVYQFDYFPDIFDECSLIESTFYICSNQPNNSVLLSDINAKINAVEGESFVPQYYATDNTSFNEKERQILTAFQNTEKSIDYFRAKVNDITRFEDNIPFVFIFAAKDKSNNAIADQESLSLSFGDGSEEGCKPNVSQDVVSHEFMHLVHGLYYKMNSLDEANMFDILRSLALEEALCDITAVLFDYSTYNRFDWSLYEELCPGDNSFRLLNDPMNSDPPQRIYYEFNFDKFDKYYWAGIISYWFYLVAEPEFKKVGDITIGNGIGGEKAEQLIFSTLEKINESIQINQNPIDNMPFDSNVNFKEFRDVVLATANELFGGANTDYNLCSAEYSIIYLAFKAVGLIDSDVELPCNIVFYGESLVEECPDFEQYFCTDGNGGKSSLTTGFPSNFSNPNDTYWIQVAVDFDENGKFEDDEYIKDLETFTDDITEHQLTVIGLPNKDTDVQILATNVTSLENELLGAVSLPYVEYVFSCNNGCNLITDINNTGYVNEAPPINTGNVNISVEKDVEICAGNYYCIDYEVNSPAFVNVTLSGDKFTKYITQSGTTNIGQFCWQPSIADLGNHVFYLIASDEHPTQPLSNFEKITVEVTTYSTFGCHCANKYPEKIVSLNNSISSGHYVALEDLESSGNLYSTADVTFKGGESVNLKNGFYVPASTNFEAYIANCPDFPEPNKGGP